MPRSSSARIADPAAAEVRLAELCDELVLRERPGLRMHALALRVDALRRLGQGERALACAEEIVELDQRFMRFDIDPVAVRAAAHAGLLDVGQARRVRAMAEKVERWLQATAKNGVPPTALDSFAHRHAAARRAMGIRPLPTLKETPGRSQVSSTPSGGLTRSGRSGGAQ